MLSLVIVNNPKDWNFTIENVEVVAAKTYVTDSEFSEVRNVRIYNLCRSYRYQSLGYYVSLLAEARGHKVFPSVSTIQDLKSLSVIRIISDEVDETLQRSLAKLQATTFDLNIYFGQSVTKQYENLSKQLYNLFQAPLLRANFVFNKKWILQNINPISLNDIPEEDKAYAAKFAEEYFARKHFRSLKKNSSIYDLAILVNPADKCPPSNARAIKNFIAAAESVGMGAEIITKDDFSKLPEFDALFIRDTTAVNHYTYRFAQRAAAEGLVVIDDPESIIKCTNKVYLAELLTKAKVPCPKTIIIHKDNQDIIPSILGFPCVLKQPDSAFSLGVAKVCNKDELKEKLDAFLDKSDLIIAQEFMPTDFDWRIGILDRTPLFACKYFMSKGHWQIVNWHPEKKAGLEYGDAQAVPINEVPDKVLRTALRAANLVGSGLYGVDLKEKGQRVVVVEINDNPDVSAGVEDGILKDNLYLMIMKSILNRIQAKKDKKE
ncbi:MAG: glutathione synthase [Gammaproteobacteria bacterium GWE2_37_16]|nr:MAG: glutathione synthase [Gammaproteobacteria bacterium GWE2_37_16]